MTRVRGRRLLAPEVVQTSAMDCGPAALKCILEGFGIPVSYGRLREACQTDVDGTSIDVMEEVANQLGLEAEQIMLPLDHLLLGESDALPGILVVRSPDGGVHFVVPWRRAGNLVQVMDPATGRRWSTREELLERTHVHAMPLSAEAWRDWAGSESFTRALARRIGDLGIARAEITRAIEHALQDPTWHRLAALDASTRMMTSLVRAGGVDRGSAALRLLRAFVERAENELAEGRRTDMSIPSAYWSAGPLPKEAQREGDEGGEEQVLVRGAVLVKVTRAERAAESTAAPQIVSPELIAALREPPARPLRDLARMLREDGLLTPILVAGAIVVASIGAALEALVLRGALDVGNHLATHAQRLVATTALALFFLCLLGLEIPLFSHTLRMGRKLEMRLRLAFLAKIPRLSDRYFHSRPTSDMSQRAHAIHVVRQLPVLGLRLFRSCAELAITSAGLVWLDRKSAPLVIGVAIASIVLPLLTQSGLTERDLRVRAYHGTLARFYLDALLGIIPVRTHGADRALRREHESTLAPFRRAFIELLNVSISVEAFSAIIGTVSAVWLLAHFLGSGSEPAGALLLVYWALNIPQIGNDIAASMRQYPAYRNLTLRLMEPLGAIEETDSSASTADPSTSNPARHAVGSGVELELSNVTVRAAGKTILENVDLEVGAGDHVAIVGASGAGKSSLCGLLLGWHRAAEGRVLVDRAALRADRLEQLRRETAWVDPAIQLWNRSLLDNVRYGSDAAAGDALAALSPVLEAADVIRLLDRLPEGLQTSLGDGGALVSGGEGQRIRLARAMLRGKSRLVILDEPFRGLDRDKRRVLLARARELWKNATLLCVTHDVGDTLGFPRVLVIEDGHVVEDGPPRDLARDDSRYRALLAAERAVQKDLWQGAMWRRLVLSDGHLVEETNDNTRPPRAGAS